MREGRERNALSTIYRDYDWWAFLFRVRHRQMIPGIEQYDRQLVRFAWEVLGLQGGSTVLDAGSGGGTEAIELARQGAEVTGWDIAPNLVRHANQLAKEQEVPVSFRVADLMTLDVHDIYEAITLFSSTFGLLSDCEGFLARAARALKPGGAVLIENSNPLRYGVNLSDAAVAVEDLTITFSTVFLADRNLLETRFFARDGHGRIIRFRRNEREPDETIKLHSPEQLAGLAEAVGLTVEAVNGDIVLPPEPYRADAPKVIAVLRK